MKAKEYLLQIQKINCLIKNKQYEVEQWKDMAIGTTSHSDGDRVQTSVSPEKMANAVCNYTDIEAEIQQEIILLKNKKDEITRNIEKLSASEYDLLHIVYIQDRDLKEAARIKKKTYSWCTTVHGRALQHLQELLDSKEKEKVDKCKEKQEQQE